MKSANLFLLPAVLAACFLFLDCNQTTESESENLVKTTEVDGTKLYWFMPDGMRAEPDLMNIYKWAEEGHLPNIKKMMDNGSYGFSKPYFPSHTPVNFATLLTGTKPKTHGVVDGPMHVEGHPLNKVSVGGFRSSARKIPAAWSLFEDAGKDVLTLSMPGSTPPEIKDGKVIRGRWGGWGADVHAINFESKATGEQRFKQGRGNKLFFFGPQLTQYLDTKAPEAWKAAPQSFSPAREIELSSWGATTYAYIYDNTDDGVVNYNKVAFSEDKKTILADIGQTEWSEWSPVVLKWKDKEYNSNYRFHVITLKDDGFFRLRIFYNNINEHITQPPSIAQELTNEIGPMMDFVDNFPPQLIHYEDDKTTFLSEMHKTFDWHTKAVEYINAEYKPDVVFHDIYSPNQMLTSRWWLGYVDPTSDRYNDVDEKQRAQLMAEVKGMYKRLDEVIGKIMATADPNSLLVLSSDHGAHVLNKWVRINNYLAKNGYLKFTIDKETGYPDIDWKNSTAVYLKMIGIFIHPDGLDGNWTRGSGEEYEKLRMEVTNLLLELQDENGVKPVTSVTKWEDVEEFHDLSSDRCGDLIISNKAGYGWNEEVSEDLKLFDIPLKTGYKQAIIISETNAMWTPFVIMGPGVKKGHKLSAPITHIDQLPTILTLMGVEIPAITEGKVLDEILE